MDGLESPEDTHQRETPVWYSIIIGWTVILRYFLTCIACIVGAFAFSGLLASRLQIYLEPLLLCR